MTFISNPNNDPTTGSEKVTEQDSIDQKYLPQTLADETNKANGTYEYYLDMNGFRKAGIQLVLTGTISVTVEGSLQDDGTEPASCVYEDITSDVFGAASFSADAVLIDNAEKLACFHYVKIKVVTSGGGTDDYTIYTKQVY